MCGGARDALAIRRRLFDRQRGKALATVSQSRAINHQPPTPKPGAHTAEPISPKLQPNQLVRGVQLLLTTFVIGAQPVDYTVFLFLLAPLPHYARALAQPADELCLAAAGTPAPHRRPQGPKIPPPPPQGPRAPKEPPEGPA